MAPPFSRAQLAAVLILMTFATVCGYALAQSSTGGSMMATMLCRPALSSETSNATFTSTSTSLICRPVAVAMHMSNGSMKVIGSVKARASSPDFSGALTPAQVNSAFNRWVQTTMHIDPATEHTP